jgi:hypothetical protein
VTPIGDKLPGYNGICPFCRSDSRVINYKGEEKFIELLRRHRELSRQRNSKYDCIVPISGGKDSTYTLYRLVTTYGMRPLAFHYDNGFLDEQATRNLKKAVELLGVDLVINTDRRLQERYLRHNFRALPKQPKISFGRLFGLLCVGCAQGYGKSAEVLAKEHGISLVVQGGCPVEKDLAFINPAEPGITGKSARLRLAFREFRELLTTPIFWDLRYPLNISRHLKSNRVLFNYAIGHIPSRKSAISREHFFHYCKWDEKEIVETLETKLGWRRPPDRSSTTRFDCIIHLIVDAYCSKYLGISDKEMTYSLMVRRNMIDRAEALQRLEVEVAEEKVKIHDTLEKVASLLGYGKHKETIVKDWCEKLEIGCRVRKD